MSERISKDDYYLDIAESVSKRATCLRRKFGAVIVKNDEVISTGYNGAPRCRANCVDQNKCVRDELNIPKGQRYELCCSVHAEANAIISASRKEMIGGTLYLTGIDAKTSDYMEGIDCCSMCKRLVINAGINRVVCRTGKNSKPKDINVFLEWVTNWDVRNDIGGY